MKNKITLILLIVSMIVNLILFHKHHNLQSRLKKAEIKHEAKIAYLTNEIKQRDMQIMKFENEIDKKDKIIVDLEKELKKYQSLRRIDVVATAYDSNCDTGCIGITKSGHDVKNTVFKNGMRVVAVDPKIIPLKSIVHVEAETMSFVGIALDTGGAIKGHRIDVLMESRSKANQFGVQKATVTILKEGK